MTFEKRLSYFRDLNLMKKWQKNRAGASSPLIPTMPNRKDYFLWEVFSAFTGLHKRSQHSTQRIEVNVTKLSFCRIELDCTGFHFRSVITGLDGSHWIWFRCISGEGFCWKQVLLLASVLDISATCRQSRLWAVDISIETQHIFWRFAFCRESSWQ